MTPKISPAPTPGSLPPSGAAGGDLAGTYPNPTVVSLTGAAGVVSVLASTLTFAASVSPAIAQAQNASGVGNAASWYGQQGKAGSIGGKVTIGGGLGGTPGSQKSGDLLIDLGASVSNVSAKMSIVADGVSQLDISKTFSGGIALISATSQIYLEAASGQTVRMGAAGVQSLLVTPGIMTLCDATGAIGMQFTPASVGASVFTFATGSTSCTIKQADKTTNGGTGATTTLQGQNETGTTSTGGAVVVASGTGTTAAGAVSIQAGATVRIKADNTGIGFFNTAPVAKPTVTGSKAANAALTSLLTALANLGLITDSST